ncbi:MAG: phytoene desaturase family protein [Acetobacteraceae bacterium]
MTRRVAIIGAGPGGLASAMLLAHAGAEVTVYERLGCVGGRSGSIVAPLGHGDTTHGRGDGALSEREDFAPMVRGDFTPAACGNASPLQRDMVIPPDHGGCTRPERGMFTPPEQQAFRFDIGPTFFLYPRVLQEIFAAVGRNLADEVELIRLDPQYRLVFEQGGVIDATSDPVRLAEEVARISPADARNVARFMADNRAKLTAFRPVLESAFNSVRDMMTRPMIRALPALRPHRSVDQDLGRYFSDPRVRLAFSFQSKYLGMSPFRCPSLFTILAFMEYEYGVWHPVGGCGAVMDAMARVAREMGVRIRLNDPVQEIQFNGRRAVGVRSERGSQAIDALVINADFAHAMQKLVPNRLRRRWTDRRIAASKFSCSTFMLYLGIEGTVPDLPHHTIYLSKDYRRNVAEIEAGMVLPEDASFYVQNACVTDPDQAPPGHSTLYVLVPVGHLRDGGPDWQQHAARYRRLTLDRLARIGVPDIERRIRFEKMVTPVDWADGMAIHQGATFNLAHSLDQMLLRRPRNRFDDLESVYLVGGGTHPGSGLPVIFESARITSRLMTEDLGLDPGWHRQAAARPPALNPALVEAL